MTVRFATESDAAGLLAIYAQYIDTSITFEYALPSPEEFAGRIRTIGQEHPYLVCECGGQAVGYAYAHRVRERAAYDWLVELSVYLDRSYTGRGLGTALYSCLMELLCLQGIRTVMGCVTLPNPKSEALHKAMGFQLIGVSPNAGYKNGAWHNVAWFEKAVGPYDQDPAPVLPLESLSPKAVAAIFKKYAPSPKKGTTVLETERLILRPWEEADAEACYKYASDPQIGPAAGWPAHTSVENSREIIRTVLSEPETYAVVLKQAMEPVGSIGLMLKGQSNLELGPGEGEIGYWIGAPYWGQGLIPEAVRALMRYGFEDLGLHTLWCCYFDGNDKSRRVQEKCGFQYHHTNYDVPWPLIDSTKTEHVTRITREQWLQHS